MSDDEWFDPDCGILLRLDTWNGTIRSQCMRCDRWAQRDTTWWPWNAEGGHTDLSRGPCASQLTCGCVFGDPTAAGPAFRQSDLHTPHTAPPSDAEAVEVPVGGRDAGRPLEGHMGPSGSYYDTLRGMTTDPILLAAIDAAEQPSADHGDGSGADGGAGGEEA